MLENKNNCAISGNNKKSNYDEYEDKKMLKKFTFKYNVPRLSEGSN